MEQPAASDKKPEALRFYFFLMIFLML